MSPSIENSMAPTDAGCRHLIRASQMPPEADRYSSVQVGDPFGAGTSVVRHSSLATEHSAVVGVTPGSSKYLQP